MSISQLIEKLQVALDKYGDLRVTFQDEDFGPTEVDRVSFFEAGTNKWTNQSFPAEINLCADHQAKGGETL